MYTGIYNTKQNGINDLIVSTECLGNRGESVHVPFTHKYSEWLLCFGLKEGDKHELFLRDGSKKITLSRYGVITRMWKGHGVQGAQRQEQPCLLWGWGSGRWSEKGLMGDLRRFHRECP